MASFTTLGYRSLYQEIENELLLGEMFQEGRTKLFAMEVEDFGI